VKKVWTPQISQVCIFFAGISLLFVVCLGGERFTSQRDTWRTI